jgi:hypothetical protein
VVEKWVLTDFANEVKGNPTLVRGMTAADRGIRVYRFPPYPAGGVNGGHWAAVAPVGEEIVLASLHGRRYVNAAVAMALDMAAQIARSPTPPTTYPTVLHHFTITYCGVLSVRLDGKLWLAQNARDRRVSQPPRWQETERGTFVVFGPDRAEFRTRSGNVTHFVPGEGSAVPPRELCE